MRMENSKTVNVFGTRPEGSRGILEGPNWDGRTVWSRISGTWERKPEGTWLWIEKTGWSFLNRPRSPQDCRTNSEDDSITVFPSNWTISGFETPNPLFKRFFCVIFSNTKHIQTWIASACKRDTSGVAQKRFQTHYPLSHPCVSV
jgi:hypothetical protein